MKYSILLPIMLFTFGTVAPSMVQADLIVSEDFLYSQPTKELGPGGGFTRQNYGGGQNGTVGNWTGQWVSSGNGIITGSDFDDVEHQRLALLGGGLIPVTANNLSRGFSLAGVADDQTIYFAAWTGVEIDGVTNSRFFLNDPLNEDSQIGIGFDDSGFSAELGLELDTNFDEFVNDGELHQLVAKLEINATGSNERLTVWLNPSSEEQGDSISVESNVIDGVSDLSGVLQLGRLSDGSLIYWDDVAVGTTWDDVASVDVSRLTMRVNPSTGTTALTNLTGEDFDVKYYEIESDSGALVTEEWNSLNAQNVAGWMENNPSANRITESNFASSTSLGNGDSFALGSVFNAAGSQDLVARVATASGLLNLAIVEYVAGASGDFNENGMLDANDIDLLSDAVIAGTNEIRFDVNGDSVVDAADRTTWVESLANTFFGDANLDGEFNSTDFVAVFQAREYEDGIPENSGWATGDWNGDRDFDSSDFVTAFIGGAYEKGPR